MTTRVLRVPQAGGGVRFLAVSAADAAAVLRDRAMLECVTVLGQVDVDADGLSEWACIGPRYQDLAPDVVAALRAEMRP